MEEVWPEVVADVEHAYQTILCGHRTVITIKSKTTCSLASELLSLKWFTYTNERKDFSFL